MKALTQEKIDLAGKAIFDRLLSTMELNPSVDQDIDDMDIREEYTFKRVIYDNNGLPEDQVEHTFKAEELNEILEQFRYFLLGCSFTYVKEVNAVKESDEYNF